MATFLFNLYTKNWSVQTTDINMVKACIETGYVPRLYLRNDGYMRQGFAKLTHIEIVAVTSNEQASEPAIFYRAKK